MYMCNYMLYCIYNFFLWKQAPGSTVSTAFARGNPPWPAPAEMPTSLSLKQPSCLATYILTYENLLFCSWLCFVSKGFKYGTCSKLLKPFCRTKSQVLSNHIYIRVLHLRRILFSSSDSRSPGGRCWLLVHANTLEKPQRARYKTSVRLIRWCPFHYLLRIG